MRYSMNLGGVDKMIAHCFFIDSNNQRVKKILGRAIDGVQAIRPKMVDGKMLNTKTHVPCLESREWLQGVLEIFAYKVGLEYSQAVKLLKSGGSADSYKRMIENRSGKIKLAAAKRSNSGLTSYEKQITSIAEMSETYMIEFVRTAWHETTLCKTTTERENEAKASPIETKNKGLVINPEYA